MTTQIEVRGLKELQARMKQFPEQLNAAQEKTMEASLLTLWENVPPYPRISFNSSYRRTGTLGRSLGSSEGGGKGGKPSIYETKKLGSGYEGRFGTDLSYAQYVIGDTTQAAHMGYWWQMKDIAAKAETKIVRLWQTLADKLAKFLDGKGL